MLASMPLPLPLPLRWVIERYFASFSDVMSDGERLENLEYREFSLVAPTGFEPVYESRLRFCLSQRLLDDGEQRSPLWMLSV